MNSRLTKEVADEVEKLNGEIIGYADKVCDECTKYKDDVVFFIGIDPEKSDKNNPYRTGQIVGIKRDAEILKAFSFDNFIVKLGDGSRLCYIEESAGRQIGLWE